MVLKKILKLNSFGSLGVCIPSELMKELGLVAGNYVNIEKAGPATIHIVKVRVE